MKKFNFNFKFLDRFKKSNKTEDNESFEEINDGEDQSSLEPQDADLHDPLNFSPDLSNEDKTGNFSRAEMLQEEDAFSDDNPEEFAEKTLSDINIQKLHDAEQVEQEESPEYEEDLPKKLALGNRFKFKFPKIGGSESTGPSFKSRFQGRSPMNSLDKFSWNDFILKLFSPYTRVKIHGVFIILLVVTFTYLIGKSAALFLGRGAPIVSNVKTNITTPIERPDTTVQDINRISSTNLFNVKENDKSGSKKEKLDIASIICLDAEKPTSEPLKLLDTIVLQDSVKSVASVQVRGGSELVNVREGEQLNNSVEVSKINRMKIILKNLTTGDCEYIASDNEENSPMPDIQVFSGKKAQALFKSTNPSIKNNGNSFKIKRQFRDQMITNMSEVLTQAKAVQITNPDGSLAFKMTEVVPGSIYSQLNIQNDDVITSINGKKIENLNELMGLLGRIKEIDQFQIGLKRNGMNENLEYGFE